MSPLALAVTAACALVLGGGGAVAATWQARSQLVWDEASGMLVRKSYLAWDMVPEHDLEFSWDGKSAEGPITGEGRLVWRKRGVPAYDPAGVYSTYEGALRNGRPEGMGRLRTRDGLVYEGEWRDGEMAGSGVLRLANGEVFDGSFRAGAPHGAGRLTTSDGRLWHSVWRGGAEIERRPLDGTVHRVQGGGLAVNVYVDGRLNDEFRSAQDEDGFERFTYVASETDGVLNIRLSPPEIMEHWKGGAPILATARQGWSNHFETADQFGPVFILVDIANEEARTAEIVAAWIDIAESTSDFQPYLDAWGPADGCNARLDPQFSLQNSGWGGVEGARLTYAFGNESEPLSQTFETPIGDFDQYLDVSLSDGVAALGIDVGRLQDDDFQCASEADYAACLADWESSDLLAGLRGALFTEGEQLITRMWGRLDYEWTEVGGAKRQHSAPIIVDFPVLDVGFGPECGAADPVERGFPTVNLPLDVTGMRIPINYTETVAPREQKRFGFNFIAEKSSHHRFRFAVELADGRVVESPDIDLVYFLPRQAQIN